MVICHAVSTTTSSMAHVPVAVDGPVMSISGWWTRWVERNVSALIVRLRKPTISSRPWYSYFPPL